MEEPKFLISNTGIVMFSTGYHTYSVHPERGNYSEIVEALKIGSWMGMIDLVPEMPDEMKKYIRVYLDTFDLGGAL